MAKTMTDLASSASVAPRDLRVVASPNPFSVATADLELPAGSTVLELMKASGCDKALIGHAHVFITDRAMTQEPIYIPRENWARVRPKSGMHVSIRVVPGKGGGGGGKNPLRTILTIAVIAASFAVPHLAAAGYFGEGMQAFATAGNIFGNVYLGGAALSLATSLVGPALIGSTAPPRP